MHQIVRFSITSLILAQCFFAVTINNASPKSPSRENCENRPREMTVNGRNYFFSGNFLETKYKLVSWTEAREMCRKYCMDTISIETEMEFEMMKKMLEEYSVGYIWTSGRRICDNHECDRQKINRSWFWMDSETKLPATDRNPPKWSFNPW